MGGLLLLVALSAVMALASFFAGALPLSIALSQPQLRFISSIGIGILAGTALIVIIPEGIEAVVTPAVGAHQHTHGTRSLIGHPAWVAPWSIEPRGLSEETGTEFWTVKRGADGEPALARRLGAIGGGRSDAEEDAPTPVDSTKNGLPLLAHEVAKGSEGLEAEHVNGANGIPTFDIGFSLVFGFALMFLIDRLPQHATESLRFGPQTRHISLDNLGRDTTALEGEDEGDSFLGSLAPSPRRARSLATTVGLVIHAAADGIAMGASSLSSNTKLGAVVFMAILVHKAPMAFGLTSILLSQGLSKRAARGHLIVFSLAAPAGALTTWLIISVLGGASLEGEAGQWWTGMLLLFSAGTFLYVAMQSMQEDGGHSHPPRQGHDHMGMNGYGDASPGAQAKRQGPQMRDTLATIGGMLLPLLTQLSHGH